jgi:hypothetical protein
MKPNKRTSICWNNFPTEVHITLPVMAASGSALFPCKKRIDSRPIFDSLMKAAGSVKAH